MYIDSLYILENYSLYFVDPHTKYFIPSDCPHRNKNITEEQEEEEEGDCEFRLLSDVDSLSEKVLNRFKKICYFAQCVNIGSTSSVSLGGTTCLSRKWRSVLRKNWVFFYAILHGGTEMTHCSCEC